MEQTKIDIVIPVYKPGSEFGDLIKRLMHQTVVPEHIFIMQTIRDESEIMVQSMDERIRIIPVMQSEFDHGGTRALGMDKSTAEFVLMMTQDAVPADEFLVEKLVESLLLKEDQVSARVQQNAMEVADTEKSAVKDCLVAVAYARQLPKNDCHIVEQYTRQFNYPEQSCVKTKADIPTLGIKTFFCSDVCAAYRRDLFEELGGFESPVIFNEDMFFAANAIEHGYGVAYAAEAKVVHSHNYTMRQQFHRNFDLAVSQKQHPEIFEQVSSEAEGMKLVKSTIAYLFAIRKPWLVFHFGMQCVGKYAGFWMGRHYEKLSRKQILKYTMNPGYWDMREDVHE
jgi:rhamnosyltransferase